jgi:NTE family protein
MLMHLIEAEDVIRDLSGSSKMNGTWKFLTHLFNIGRERTDQWLAANFDRVGVESTIDVHAKYM